MCFFKTSCFKGKKSLENRLMEFVKKINLLCSNKSYQKIFVEWFYWRLNLLIKKVSLIIYFFVIIATVLIYHTSISWNISAILLKPMNCIVKILGVEGFTDTNIKVTITTILGFITVIISLLSAIYVFTHREQKNVSPSASTDTSKNVLVFKVICLMIINVTLGYLIVQGYNSELTYSKAYESSLSITKQYLSRIVLLLILSYYLLNEFLKLIKYLFKTMSIEDMLQDSVEQVSNNLSTIVIANRYKEFSQMKPNQYKKFHFSLESVFQNLKFVAEHNMNQEFEDNIRVFKNAIVKMKETNEVILSPEKQDNLVASYLLKNDGPSFMHAYNSALRSNLSLISYLLKNQQYNKAKEAVSLYYDLFLDSDEILVKIFKISLNDFIYILDTKDEKQLIIFLEGLYQIPKINSHVTYKFLLMKLINEGEIKNLTNIVYDYKQFGDFRKRLIIIFLQLLIKSIEIANYQITGFMVKFLITNFRGEEIDRALRVLDNKKVKGNLLYSSVLEADEIIEGINDNGVFPIKINEETFKYCLGKAYILLFAQNYYVAKEKLWFVVNKEDQDNSRGIQLKLAFEDYEYEYSRYIINKTEAAASKYGLLFFNDQEVMKIVYKELELDYGENLVENASSISSFIKRLKNKIYKY